MRQVHLLQLRTSFCVSCGRMRGSVLPRRPGGISGEMVRDLMLLRRTTVRRHRARHPVQWLADNGSAYTALVLVACFTPGRSPESNGVSEAFVKTLKRDYTRIQSRPDDATVLQMLPSWIKDYNDNHPHSGLRMRSPP